MITEQKPLKLVDLSDIDTLYGNIKNDKLHLSPNIKFKHLGAGGDIIQFLCSWQRKKDKVSIILNNKVNIEKIDFKDEVLLIAFYLAEKVLFKDGDIRDYLLKKFVPFVEDMNSRTLDGYLQAIKAREIKFLCLGGARNEYLKLFYNSDKSFKSKLDIENLVENIFRSPFSPIKSGKYPHNELNAIKEIIYEAFKNTDQHGSRDIKYHKIPKNIRALTVNFVSFNNTDKTSFIKHQQDYQDFLHDVKDVLVISIFDSGEGMVKKYIETTTSKKEIDLSYYDKKEILQDVFRPGVSSSTIPNSGMGLTYIEDQIKKVKGLLRIRTGSLELFLPPKHPKHPKQKEECQKKIKEIARVGTLITILIPIGFTGDNSA